MDAESEISLFDVDGVVRKAVNAIFRLSPAVVCQPMLFRVFEPLPGDAVGGEVLDIGGLILECFGSNAGDP